MSWSINLSGSRKSILRELEDAQSVIERARYAAMLEEEGLLLSVSCSGSAYSSPDGTGGGGASFSVGTFLPTPPPEQPQDDAVPEPATV